MSEELGPLTLGHKHGPVFLGRDLHEDRNYSEEVAAKIDVEIRKIVDSSYDNATRILTENREAMDRIVNALLEKETITGEELDRLINNEPEAQPPVTPTESDPPASPQPITSEDKEEPRRAPQGLQPGLAGA
jgi:cell division protease FtsH